MSQFLVLLITALAMDCRGLKNLSVLSPLKALTIWDTETRAVGVTSSRSRFMPILKSQLMEGQTRPSMELKNELKAVTLSNVGKSTRKYQFVGVIDPKVPGRESIKWYARGKPVGARWSVRLVHVDEAAIATDLFRRGRVDISVRYECTKKTDDASNVPRIKGEYALREHSLRNLWNLSFKSFVLNSSGMYWRERRLRPGLYTDGSVVFESSYRYRDGRNGMHRMSTLQRFLASKSVNPKLKNGVIERIKVDVPDLVLE